MAKNERKTENITREHFKKYTAELIIEEQSSDNPKIKKLLSTASKAGNGAGHPEFIMQFRNNPDLLILVECKADIKKHESSTLDQYRDYAVDGALLYSAYLSREYDVLSIAVSGENKKELKISHFLQLKGEQKALPKFSDKFLSSQEYLTGYIKSPEKFRQDYDKLIIFSKDLNDTLHSHKIVESERALLIACILIALENKAFEASYKNYSKPEDLAKYLVDTVDMEFKNGGIQKEKLDVISGRLAFIKTDTSLSKKANVLRDIISSINENIKDFIKTHKYIDVLGQLYIEFLRYANSDKGLGIVLTPLHITEFMARIAEVNKDSIVYDNCVGTGGFLVSAMSIMIEDAKDDLRKIKNIKKNQLVGVEYQAHIFVLACSNMFIHQDGKSNILNGSCLDGEIIKKVKKFKPTAGLLNPPYKSDKKKDTEELEFVFDNLECLVQGGKCVAIVPMQSALAQSGRIYEWKKKLLSQHTLEAVFSMPDELFFNSDVGVVACVMVFTAKRPHPAGKKTYFGYYKKDGFVKRKTKGRIDLYEEFERKIKNKWIVNYQNRETIPGFSVTKEITAKDEWCPEAYMETDYSGLVRKDFEKTLVEYCSFLLSNQMTNNILSNPVNKNKYELEVKKWKSFSLDKLFNITGSKTTSILDLEEFGEGEFPFVTTQATNNGIAGFYNYHTEAGNILTVDSAVLGFCAYQPFNFSASDHVEKLCPKFKMNKYIGLFLATIINLERYRYNYGRKASQTRLKERSIKLPANGKDPDWKFIENYIKSLPYSSSI
ncbi:MAG: N-6 DNA methylase [Patescibacteria group bacterium]